LSQSSSLSKTSLASFRDPAGAVLSVDGHILRFVRPAGMADFNAIWQSKAVQDLFEKGRLVKTDILDGSRNTGVLAIPEVQQLRETLAATTVLEHARVPFPSFPYEWAPDMLRAAALLTLEMAVQLLDDGMGLKDATPYNILFNGPVPVFVDLLSIERRAADDPIWIAYAQFIRTFVLPLLVNRYFGLSLDQILTTRRDGLEPEEVYRWLGPLQKFRPAFLTLVTIPSMLASREEKNEASLYSRRSAGSTEKARFILQSQFRQLRSAVNRFAPKSNVQSTWSGYMGSLSHYSDEQFQSKEKFVRDALAEYSPQSVLDVGCNTGHFSALAAQSGAQVVAIDYDPVVVGQVWRTAHEQKLNILPLAVNLTRPTPGVGWRNDECPSFLKRARGSFNAVMMLAVIHHMLVTERVPLSEIIDLAAELTTDVLIIEFIAPDDPMFRRILRGRGELHKDLDYTIFETTCQRHFEIVRSHHNDGSTRWLYLLRKK
jgi:SAM-dependent methyltransferase